MLLRRVVLTAAKGFAVLNPWGEMRCPDSTVVGEQACVRNHSRGVELCNRAKETREARCLIRCREMLPLLLLSIMGYTLFPWAEPPLPVEHLPAAGCLQRSCLSVPPDPTGEQGSPKREPTAFTRHVSVRWTF